MNTIKNVTEIGIMPRFKGNGCVNYDRAEQKYELMSRDLLNGDIHNNLLFSKKIFYKDDSDDSYYFKHVVSSECIRHSIFGESLPYDLTSLRAAKIPFFRIIAHPDMIVRGYVFPSKTEDSIHKSSTLSITRAIEESNGHKQVSLNVCTKAGGKRDSSESEIADTSLYYKENLGELYYNSEGFISLDELQFISADKVYDRLAIDLSKEENKELYFANLKRNFPTLEPSLKYYYITTSAAGDEYAEKGILLDPESVDYMVKRTIKNIMNIRIIRKDAFFMFDSIKLIAYVNNDGNKKEEIEIDPNNIDNYFFEYRKKYAEADEGKILKNIETIKKYISEQNRINNETKERIKAKRASKLKESENGEDN